MSISFSSRASRPARLSAALKVGFVLLIANMAAAGAAALATNEELAGGTPAVASAPAETPTKMQCREVTVSLDEGYGLQGHETRTICTRAL